MAEVLDTASYQWPKWPWKKVDAVNDTATTNEDSAVTIKVLGNDKNYTGVYKIFDDNKISDVSLTDSALTDSLVAAEDYTTSLYPKPYTITLDSGAKVTLLEDNTVTYDPNGQFNDLKDGQSEYDSFSYAAYGRGGTDAATVTVTITGVNDPSGENQAPVAVNDYTFVNSYPYPYPQPYPYPETYSVSSAEADASGETTAVEADLSDDLIFTTLALGEEGDPYPGPESTRIDVLANDSDPDGDAIKVGYINGEKVERTDDEEDFFVTLKSGATVTLNDDGTLTYKGGILNYYSSDPLATEGDTTYTVSEGADGQLSLVETELWEPVPLPYPKPILFDSFTYDAEDEHGARDQATVFVYRDYLYYYDVGTDPVAETSQDVGDPGLLTV